MLSPEWVTQVVASSDSQIFGDLSQSGRAVVGGGRSSDADHLELREPGDEFAQGLMGAQVVHLILLTGVMLQVVKHVSCAAVDLLPERCRCTIQSVVHQRVEIKQHAGAVRQRREDGLCDFLNTHSRKNISPAWFLRKCTTILLSRRRFLERQTVLLFESVLHARPGKTYCWLRLILLNFAEKSVIGFARRPFVRQPVGVGLGFSWLPRLSQNLCRARQTRTLAPAPFQALRRCAIVIAAARNELKIISSRER